MYVRGLLVLVPLLLCVSQAFAADLVSAFMSGHAIKCYGGEGNGALWKNGAPQIQKGSMDSKPSIFQYDPVKEEATGFGNSGQAKLSVLPTAIGISLVELAPAGFPVLTTIYSTPIDLNGRFFPMVYSRHTFLAQQAFPQQYYGKCEFMK